MSVLRRPQVHTQRRGGEESFINGNDALDAILDALEDAPLKWKAATYLLIDTGCGELVAADQVGAGKGDRVLLATGTVASRYCMDAPIDAAVVAILDHEKID